MKNNQILMKVLLPAILLAAANTCVANTQFEEPSLLAQSAADSAQVPSKLLELLPGVESLFKRKPAADEPVEFTCMLEQTGFFLGKKDPQAKGPKQERMAQAIEQAAAICHTPSKSPRVLKEVAISRLRGVQSPDISHIAAKIAYSTSILVALTSQLCEMRDSPYTAEKECQTLKP